MVRVDNNGTFLSHIGDPDLLYLILSILDKSLNNSFN